jgi:hypothetical protein
VSLFRSGARLVALPAPDRRATVEAIVQLTRASVELRVVRSRAAVRLLGELQGSEVPVDTTKLHEAELVGRAIARAAARLPWRPTCLRQALAAKRMLSRRRIPSRIHVGVTAPHSAEAHAWVTVDGLPVVGRPGLERFVPLAAFA